MVTICHWVKCISYKDCMLTNDYEEFKVFLVVFLLWKEMDMLTRVQILKDSVYISHYTNTLGKCVYLIILPPVVGK